MSSVYRSIYLPYQFNTDDLGLIVQRDNGKDGGDTAARTGQYGLAAWIFEHELHIDTLNYGLFPDSLKKLEVEPGKIVRHPIQYNEVEDIPGDQLMPMIIAAGLYKNKKFIRNAVWNIIKNFGRFPNNDLVTPGDWSAIFRALNAWYLYPLIVIGDALGVLANSSIISFWKGREPGFIRKFLGKYVHYSFIQDYEGDPNNPDSWSSHGKNNVGDDVRHIQHLLQAELKLPTPFSYLAKKIYAKFRPSYAENVNGPQYALNHYFRVETFANPFHIVYAELLTHYLR